MFSWLRRPTARRNPAPAAPARRPARPTRFRPDCELLEGREVPSTASSIAANFNGTAIPAGDTIWFNAAFQASGLPKTSPVTIHVENGSINYTAGGLPYHIAVPNAEIVLTPGATSACTSYDPTDGDWDVSAPSGGAGDVFMGGVAVPVTASLPGGIKNVTWSADFWADTAGITVNWKWGAAVYNSFSTDCNCLNVKPVDSKTLSVYQNADQSDTPEAFKSSVVGGGTGGGGTNYTGNFTSSTSVKVALGDGLQEYPYASSNPLTSIAFNESTVLRAANLDTTNGYFQVWYSDEHALALGINSVTVKAANGTTTTTNYPVAAMNGNPAAATETTPNTTVPIGTTATSGDQAGTDTSGRPMAPMLYITDTTTNPNSRSGDWQWGGAGYAPSDVFGTWKAFTKAVDYTTATPTVTVTTGVDPAKNNWNLGAGADPVPAGLTSEGYGAEIRWNLNDLYARGILQAGHTYRFYVMVHDGDQNKTGGDAGQASFTYSYPGPTTPTTQSPATISGTVVDNFGNPEAGVTLTLTNTTTGQTFTAVTNSNGVYLFTNVMPGIYTITETPPASSTQTDSSIGLMTMDGNPDGTGTFNNATISGITVQSGDIEGTGYDFMNYFGTMN